MIKLLRASRYSDDPHKFKKVEREDILKDKRLRKDKDKRDRSQLLHRQPSGPMMDLTPEQLKVKEKEQLRLQEEQRNFLLAQRANRARDFPVNITAPATVVAAGGAGAGSSLENVDDARGGAAAVPHLPLDRKSLQNIRVVQRNLIYVIGIPSSIASEDILRRAEYFGQYGKIVKIVVNRNHSGSNMTDSRSASASAYITFADKDDARACIQAVDGFFFESRAMRASFGTTKYCNAFLRNMTCSNPECLYLHELGEDEDSFTKEQIQSGANNVFRISNADGLASVDAQIVMIRGQGGPSRSGLRAKAPILPVPNFCVPPSDPRLSTTSIHKSEQRQENGKMQRNHVTQNSTQKYFYQSREILHAQHKQRLKRSPEEQQREQQDRRINVLLSNGFAATASYNGENLNSIRARGENISDSDAFSKLSEIWSDAESESKRRSHIGGGGFASTLFPVTPGAQSSPGISHNQFDGAGEENSSSDRFGIFAFRSSGSSRSKEIEGLLSSLSLPPAPERNNVMNIKSVEERLFLDSTKLGCEVGINNESIEHTNLLYQYQLGDQSNREHQQQPHHNHELSQQVHNPRGDVTPRAIPPPTTNGIAVLQQMLPGVNLTFSETPKQQSHHTHSSHGNLSIWANDRVGENGESVW